MRGQSRNPLQTVFDIARRQTIAALHRGGYTPPSTQFGASTPPSFVTTEGETEDGEIFTIKSAFTELDTTEDPGALTSP